MTYSINGILLDDPAAGWELLPGTVPRLGLSVEIVSVRVAGRDGVVHRGGQHSPGQLKFQIVSKDAAARSSLYALFRAPNLVVTDSLRPGFEAVGRVRSGTVDGVRGWETIGEDSFIVEIPSGTWRDTTVTTSPFTAAAVGGAYRSLWPGLSAPVQDAIIRVKGPITDPEVVDTSGAFLAFAGSLSASEYLRFDSSNGRAWLTTSDTWAGGTEMSGLMDWGGPRGVFEVTPRFPTPGATAREGRVNLRQASSGAGAGFVVRGRGAYLM